MFTKLNNKFNKGAVLVYLIIVIFVFSLLMVPLLGVVLGQINYLKSSVAKEQALQIAEAGVNYYQWHLAHFPQNYTEDGQPHSYVDVDTQQEIGKYSLEITPPTVGSTVVTIKSTGWTNSYPNIKRVVTVRYGIPSLAKYSFLSNGAIWIGSDESVSGQMLANTGIRFDGFGNAPIQAYPTTYTCGSSQGCSPSTTKPGVWGSAPQYVQNFWKYPVPSVNFAALTSTLASMKSLAQSDGIYLAPSSAQGYSLVFKEDGTIDIYKVITLLDTPSGQDVNRVMHNEDIDYNNRTLQFTKEMPVNGIIYVEDNVWVEGVVKGRATVAAAVLPYNANTAPTIYIPNNIVYSSKDGSDVLGLIAQKNVVVTYNAPSDLEVDAAMVAQNGACQFYYFQTSPPIKNSITIYGSIMTNGQWTWTWVNGSGQNISGYTHTYSNYDGNLLYAPPPSFPLSTTGYQQLDWKSN